MALFDNGNKCDSCGAPLDPDDIPVHLCKVCQGMLFDEWQNENK